MSEILNLDQLTPTVQHQNLAGVQLLGLDAQGNVVRISHNASFLDRGQIDDCDKALDLGMFHPSSVAVGNAPTFFALNTSDTIMNVGNCPTWFTQIYMPYLSIGRYMAIRNRAGNKFEAWKLITF